HPLPWLGLEPKLDGDIHEGADPNAASQNGLTPLHYVSMSRAPPIFVRKLLEAKAHPNVCTLQQCTPLHVAAINDREDVVKELLSAGALVTVLPPHPEHSSHNKKIVQIIHNLASKGHELCSKIKYFVEVQIAVREKPHKEVFRTFDSHMLREDPQTHLTMIEILFNDLIEWMIHEEPKSRPKVEQCLSHPFFWACER
uniref:Uncharacterized protein n=1 Tax=Seriola lalandi dorsalis TaxID=1841481 RepID=A0A3B4WNR9_SERLL